MAKEFEGYTIRIMRGYEAGKSAPGRPPRDRFGLECVQNYFHNRNEQY